MQQSSRHQCLIYEGSPARYLPALAALMREKLNERYRCLYLNSPPMVAGMRSYLAAAGVEVAREVRNGSLVLSCDQEHLANGHFNSDSMLRTLEEAVQQALSDGYAGLWATGDMTWEFGSKKEMSKLLEYEWKLEDLFGRQPCLSGVCQYHLDTLPHHAVREGLLTHQTIFINETLSRVNPHYVTREAWSTKGRPPNLEDLKHLLQEEG
ncbi:MAG: MEDS domain-containing protein [Acidobacteriota bacterium]|nr:MEDS domain-containing protein [Acidobacteriota bacterium]